MKNNIEKIIMEYTKESKNKDKNYISNFLILLDINIEKFKVIHIAGTNGKGSASYSINEFLVRLGKNVGLFTSPHLIKINERIRCNSREIKDEEIYKYFKVIKNVINKNSLKIPTFFEIMFLISICFFNSKKVDYIVLETGIGGKNDITNIMPNKILSIITNIGIDHCEILGDTLLEICKEKAGIINKNSCVVFLDNKKCVTKIILNTAKRKDSKAIRVRGFKKYTLSKTYKKENEKLAFYSLKYLIKKEKLAKVKRKIIMDSCKNNKLQGRLQILDNIILDGAHNLQGLSSFVNSINAKNFEFIIAISKKKHKNEMIEYLANANLKHVYFTNNKKNELEDPKVLKKEYDKYKKNSTIIEFENIFNIINNKNRKFVICGSLYLVGDVLSILKEK